MLLFKKLETSVLISFNGRSIFLSESDIDKVWGQTVDLYDNNHKGSAAVTLGLKTFALPEEDWQAIFAASESYIQSDLEFEELMSIPKH